MQRTPGEDLIGTLEQLRLRLNRSGTERTIGIRDNLGDNCPYYKKSLDKFLREDYVDLRNLMKQAQDLIDLVEGLK